LKHVDGIGLTLCAFRFALVFGTRDDGDIPFRA